MVYIIHEILVLLKKSLELSERYFFQMLFKKYHASKKIIFFISYNDEKSET